MREFLDQSGKFMFIMGLVSNTIIALTQDYINTGLAAISGILGIIWLGYKIHEVNLELKIKRLKIKEMQKNADGKTGS
jgi:uncharacterized membrane protein YciS (DUF1049 family)